MKKTIIASILFVFLLVSCGKGRQTFTIEGEIQGNTHKTLYLEKVGISKITVLDSVALTGGKFKFKHERPQTPDFYRLHLGNQLINLAIDSTETIIVKAGEANFAKEYTLEGEKDNSLKIKELTLLQLETTQQFNAVKKQYEANEITNAQYVEQANQIINRYKEEAKKYIFLDFLSPVAYFALFQQVNNLLIFDLYDKDDNKLFGAVANAWNTVYPESPRAVQLKNVYTQSRAVLRGEKVIDLDAAESKALFDISLPALDGKEVRLSEIGQGKIVLIDFTVYGAQQSPLHNRQLADIYAQYHAKGLEIYQISLDQDDHIWKNSAVNLPWICVQDLQSVFAQKYNVSQIPTAFIMNKEGEIVERIEDYSTLSKKIIREK
ncbi:hypothetical protein AGMMS50262_15040 [Bacteroidia bacterium]|nr:hypothetical protein AGMMS50262_15040 [Bacteroidia bacterium]